MPAGSASPVPFKGKGRAARTAARSKRQAQKPALKNHLQKIRFQALLESGF